MYHSFDIDVAKRYGLLAATILNNIYFWVEENRANGQNEHDGSYWTYNSTRAFAELFPYATPRQIATALKKLIDDGVLVTGNYNKSAYDRTMWYALTDKGYSIIQKCKMDSAENANGSAPNVEPIPDINPDENADSKPNINKKAAKADTIKGIIGEYTQDEETRELLTEWVNARKVAKKAPTPYAMKLALAKLDKMASQSSMSVNAYLREIIIRGWQGFYPIQQSGGKSGPNTVTINGREYECRGGKYYIPNGSGVAVNPYADRPEGECPY